MNLLLRFLVTAVLFYCIIRWVPGFAHDQATVGNALIVAIIFGLVNMFIGPILRLVSLPVSWISHGFFSLVINYILFMITIFFDKKLSDPMALNPWEAGLIGAIIMMIGYTLVAQVSQPQATA